MTPTVELAFDKIIIRFGSAIHCMFYRSKLLGFQSWRYGDKNYSIEYAFDGGEMTCEYNDEAKWLAVLAGLEKALN